MTGVIAVTTGVIAVAHTGIAATSVDSVVGQAKGVIAAARTGIARTAITTATATAPVRNPYSILPHLSYFHSDACVVLEMMFTVTCHPLFPSNTVYSTN